MSYEVDFYVALCIIMNITPSNSVIMLIQELGHKYS